MATSVAGDIFGNEELLFSGVVTGNLEQYKEQLNSLGDVDVRGLRQRTLLYVAVGLGKVDWVEGLLEKGANPGLRDGEGVSVSELAQGLAEKNVEHEDRQSISKLVRLVMVGRDSVAQGGIHIASTCQDKGMESMGQDMMSDLSRKITSMCDSMNQVQVRMVTLRQEITTNRDLINEKNTTNRDLINNVKNEMASINAHAMQVMSTIRNSIDDLKAGLAPRDVLLSVLENSMTPMADTERTGAQPDPETPIVTEEVVQSAPRTEEELREECVEAMMRKTRILESDERKVTRARFMYEKLYSEWDETACLVKFLRSQDDVSIEIDFDSQIIGRMKSSFTDHDGVERGGSKYGYFANFEEKKVYLGGNGDENWIIGWLAGALAQMSVCLAFNNGGRPYAKGDDVTERQMKNALKEAEEEYRRIGDGVDGVIQRALGLETQRGKEVYLTSAVPHIIASYGSTNGTSELQRRFPLLLGIFRDSVMPALLAKTQV